MRLNKDDEMDESILNSIKQLLGIKSNYTFFDQDIIIDINSVFTILNQLGVGKTGFSIEDDTTTWDEFLEGYNNLSLVKTYMFMKVKMMFDPPQSGTAIEAYNRQISEFEWRINVAVDPEKDNVLAE